MKLLARGMFENLDLSVFAVQKQAFMHWHLFCANLCSQELVVRLSGARGRAFKAKCASLNRRRVVTGEGPGILLNIKHGQEWSELTLHERFCVRRPFQECTEYCGKECWPNSVQVDQRCFSKKAEHNKDYQLPTWPYWDQLGPILSRTSCPTVVRALPTFQESKPSLEFSLLAKCSFRGVSALFPRPDRKDNAGPYIFHAWSPYAVAALLMTRLREWDDHV